MYQESKEPVCSGERPCDVCWWTESEENGRKGRCSTSAETRSRSTRPELSRLVFGHRPPTASWTLYA